jgi:hypothetical protein
MPTQELLDQISNRVYGKDFSSVVLSEQRAKVVELALQSRQRDALDSIADSLANAWECYFART